MKMKRPGAGISFDVFGNSATKYPNESTFNLKELQWMTYPVFYLFIYFKSVLDAL